MNKLKSVKLWVTIWACSFLTYIVVANKTDWSALALAISAIPIAYGPLNISQKNILQHQQHIEETEGK